jgi:myo-inositol-1(or 4)-monophosphatase
MSGWAIDPIDGTTNFLRGLPMWGISIGVLENGVSVAGAIALPDLDLVLVSDAGKPLQVNGQIWVRRTGPIGGNLIALGENDWETGE